METINILLVDDEEQFRISTTRVLSRRGFTVDTAENGQEAMRKLQGKRPDVVLLDLKMEVMDGLSTLEAIRNNFGDLPVIILTGHGGLDDAIASIHLQVTEFLQKPVDVDRLAVKIRNILHRKESMPLREKTVVELMIPVDSYQRVYADQPAKVALHAIRNSYLAEDGTTVREGGHRSILVFDRKERLVGMLRMLDVLEMIEPRALADSPYSTYFTGMFLAQTRVFGNEPIQEYLTEEELIFISEHTPLMEALVLMVKHRIINLPVMRNDRIVGVLRDRDLFLEVLENVLGEK